VSASRSIHPLAAVITTFGAVWAFAALPVVAAAQEAASTQALTVAAATPAPAPHIDGQYRINSGDELDVFVWGEERMQRAVRVQPDGTIAFPLAGTIKAVDRNVTDVAAEIRERIAVNYRSTVPDVTVSVREAAGMRFYVVGKVRTPGSYTSGTSVNVLQAISVAGGTSEFADIKHAVILRQTPTGQVVEPVKLSTLLKGGRALDAGALATPLPILLSGDVLVIP
jgi:polysaccharide export outer membrane protein